MFREDIPSPVRCTILNKIIKNSRIESIKIIIMDMCKGAVIIRGFKFSLCGFQVVGTNRGRRIPHKRGLLEVKSSLNQKVNRRKEVDWPPAPASVLLGSLSHTLWYCC
jgi:hypothetical protein